MKTLILLILLLSACNDQPLIVEVEQPTVAPTNMRHPLIWEARTFDLGPTLVIDWENTITVFNKD